MTDLKLPRGVQKVLKAEDKDYDRGLLVKLLENGGYSMAYWYEKPDKPAPVEVLVDGKSIKKDAKVVEMKFHPKEYHEKNKTKEKVSEGSDKGGLRGWFKDGGWDRYNSKGEKIGKCGGRKPGEAKPKCFSKEKAAALGKKGRAKAVRRKRREDPNPNRKGAPIDTPSTPAGLKKRKQKGSKMRRDSSIEIDSTLYDRILEKVLLESRKKNKNRRKRKKKGGKKDACYHKVKASASVWPSAYASGRLVQCRKKGASNYGTSKKESEEVISTVAKELDKAVKSHASQAKRLRKVKAKCEYTEIFGDIIKEAVLQYMNESEEQRRTRAQRTSDIVTDYNLEKLAPGSRKKKKPQSATDALKAARAQAALADSQGRMPDHPNYGGPAGGYIHGVSP